MREVKYFTLRKAWPNLWMFGVAWGRDGRDHCFMVHFGAYVLLLGPHFSDED